MKFLAQRWFLIALVGLFLAGSFFWRPFVWVASDEAGLLRDAVVAGVLFLMALPVEARAMWQALRRPLAPLLAILVSCLILPLCAWGLAQLLEPELAGGFLVAASIPCTLASAAVWTRQAGGNDSVAVLVTIVTNLLCFLITPVWLVIMLGGTANVGSLDAVELIKTLLFIVVLPIGAAQILRLRSGIAGWASRHKKSLGMLTQCGILSFVFTGAVQTGQRLASQTGPALPFFDLGLMIVLVTGLHTAMLFTGLYLSRVCRLPREDGIAVGFAGSQKTLMIGLGIAVESGFSVLPIITYHIGQLLIDTLVADYWRQQGEQRQGEESPQV